MPLGSTACSHLGHPWPPQRWVFSATLLAAPWSARSLWHVDSALLWDRPHEGLLPPLCPLHCGFCALFRPWEWSAPSSVLSPLSFPFSVTQNLCVLRKQSPGAPSIVCVQVTPKFTSPAWASTWNSRFVGPTLFFTRRSTRHPRLHMLPTQFRIFCPELLLCLLLLK